MANATKLTACDLAATGELLSKIKLDGARIADKVRQLNESLTSGDLDVKNGISFLDMKNELLGQYNVDLCNLVSHKVDGLSIEDNPSVERLVELRTYIEKTRPIERKLKYQIEKLLKIAAAGGLSKDDPLHLKPNPANMASRFTAADDQERDESVDTLQARSSSKKEPEIYRPPMMASAHFEEEVSRKEREERMLAKAKKRALSTAMMRELRTEYSEAPEEFRDDINVHRLKQTKEDKHKVTYEEDNFKRLAVTKEDKKRRREFQTMGTLDRITRFGDISALTADTGASFNSKKKKTKTKSKGSKKKKFSK